MCPSPILSYVCWGWESGPHACNVGTTHWTTYQPMLISTASLSHCLFVYFQIWCGLSELLPLPSLLFFLIEDTHTEDTLRNSIMAVGGGPSSLYICWWWTGSYLPFEQGLFSTIWKSYHEFTWYKLTFWVSCVLFRLVEHNVPVPQGLWITVFPGSLSLPPWLRSSVVLCSSYPQNLNSWIEIVKDCRRWKWLEPFCSTALKKEFPKLFMDILYVLET